MKEAGQKRQIQYDLIYMWNLKNKQNEKIQIQRVNELGKKEEAENVGQNK